jgi:hypothetical protein
MQPDELALVDSWIIDDGRRLTRPEAIRRLIAIGLKVKKWATPRPQPICLWLVGWYGSWWESLGLCGYLKGGEKMTSEQLEIGLRAKTKWRTPAQPSS